MKRRGLRVPSGKRLAGIEIAHLGEGGDSLGVVGIGLRTRRVLVALSRGGSSSERGGRDGEGGVVRSSSDEVTVVFVVLRRQERGG